MKKFTLFLVAIFAMVNVANAQRAWAYDLGLTSESESYTFTFKAVTAANATLVFYQDGVGAGTLNLGSVAAGQNTVTKTSAELLSAIQKSGDFTWGVTMTGGAIALAGNYLTELTAAGQGLDFYLPQGVVVDNNPESETFSTLFIAEAQGGKLSVGPTHRQGIYHYSQKLTELNPTDQGIIPSNVTLTNGSRQEMHRIAINPKNNHVAFALNVSGKAAVWSVPANNPAGEATNLIAGTAITMPNSICFDENGVLYVMDNANATTGGTLYKVVDGVATKIAQNKTWQEVDNSLAYDGRGGIWIAQTSTGTTWPSYAILSHVNSNGEIDWSALDHSSDGLFSAGNSYGYSQRGQCAYNPKEDLLVLGGNCRSHIFQVSYAAGTGKPSLTLKYRTPYIKASTNIDGAAFDYAGDLYLMSAARERLYKYAVPTNNNTCTTPAPKAQTITLVETKQYTITATSADDNMGTVTGSGTYYEGETVTLKAVAKNTYYFVNWSDGNTDATRTFIAAADVELTANFAKAFPRTWAYDLMVAENGDKYEFTFNATAAGSATLLFADIDGNELVAAHAVGTVAAGANTVTLAKTTFEGVTKDVYWSVKMDGEAIPAISEITDASKGIYNFYLPQGVAVDNNPESSTFSKIYIAESTDGASDGGSDRADNQKRGIFIYDQTLAELNPTNKGIIPSNVTLTNTTRNALKRIAINPKTNEVAFAYNASPAAVWAVSTENVAGEATNLLAGLGFDYCNSLCFDENGILYIFDNGAGYPAKGSLYKIVNGEKHTIFSENSKYGNADNSLASDGRGGLWIAQNRSKLDGFNQLAHVSASGVIDFEVNSTTTNGFASLETSRGAMAYNPRENILAIGCGASGTIGVSLYQVTYDPSTGVPSLEYIGATPSLGTNVEGIAFDYAGDLYALSANTERFYKFTLPTDENICTVPAPSSQKLVLGTQCEVTVTVNDPAMGSVEGAGQYEKGVTVELEATANEHYQFVNWTKGVEVLSAENPYSFTVQEDVTITANFAELPKYTITVQANNATMGSVEGGGTVYVGESVEIRALPNLGHAFIKWDDGNTSAIRTIKVDGNKTYTAIFQAMNPRAWAYDLRMVEDGDNYKFTFKATSASDATLLFTNKAGIPVDPTSYAVGTVGAGETSVKIAKSKFGGTEDIYWSVQMDGAAIENMIEITDASKGIYEIVAPQGIAVDNNTDSKYFGQVYVAAATDGTVSRGAQTRGIFVYDPILNELNSPNAGYLPANATLTDNTRQAIHRVAVNPTNNQVAFAYNISGSSAIWSMNPENLAGDAVNLIEGSGITKANSLCFDEDGTLYVMDNANTTTGGNIYKIQNGEANMFATAQKGYHWGVEENAMSPDGRGGLWIAQNRWQVDGYPVLSHIDKNGVVDFAVTSSSPEALKALFPNDDNNASYRGQCAYYVADDILAFGGNKEAVLFKVTYDAHNVPTNLEKLLSTCKLGTNIDGLAFDYAGDLYVASETTKRLYKFVIPTNDNICTIPAPESQAIIKEVRYNITVNVVGNGTATGTGEYVEGETASLKATPAAHHQFVNWTFDDETTSTDNPLEIVVNSDITVTANFEPIQYTVVALTNDENKGTVSGAGAYDYGTEVTLTATPEQGYKLLYWSDRSTENPRTITMTKNEALSAYFVKEYVVEPTFTIEKVWENTNVPASTNNGYQAVGWAGKIYVKDRGNDKIIVYSDATTSGDYAQTDNADDQSIAVDNAGNLVLRSGSTNFYDAPTQIILYKKGETTYKTIDFTLPETGRCDFISASGDLFSAEGGYVYFYCQNKSGVSRLHIKNGGANASDVTVDFVGNITTVGNTQSHVMADIFGNLVTHSRTNAITTTINAHTGETMTFTLPTNHKANALGGCSFELAGKEFWAFNVKGTNTCTSEWNLYNLTDGAFVSSDILYAKNTTDKNSAANWLNVQVVDENTAYIYQFCPTVAVAVWKVTMHEVVLRDTENNEDLLTDLTGNTTNVSVYRSLTAGMYNTLCLPFDVDDFSGTPLENTTVWQYNGAEVKGDGTNKEIFLEFDEVESITAGEPYLVEPAEDIAAPMEFKNVTISVTNGSEIAAHTAVTMYGILHPTELEADDKSILFLVENNNLAWANETANMNGMRAYFKVNEPSLLTARTRAYIRKEPTVATDMENITTTDTKIKKVIYNGNIYIIRGNEVYTVQGTKVK